MTQALSRHERQKLRAQIHRSIEQSGSAILCTLIGKDGAFYRPIGFQCAIDAQGRVAPFFAGSCTDRLVADLARERLKHGQFPTIVQVNSGSAEDALFGSGSGCGGRVEILCEQLTAERLSQLDLLIGPDMTIAPTTLQLKIQMQGTSLTVQRRIEPPFEPDHASASTRQLTLKRDADPRLWVVGGADDAFALTRQAMQIGWWAGLIDHRKVDLGAETRIADQIFQSRPNADTKVFSPQDHVIIMSHNLELDSQWLEHLATHPVASIGLLGPFDRCERVLGQLHDSMRPKIKEKLRMRTGVKFKCRSPELLAVAIMAELQTIWENDRHSESAEKMNEQ